MTQIKAKCKETRYVGHDKYFAGRDYVLDAVRAGKYNAYFDPISIQDAEIVNREWGDVKAKFEEEQQYRAAQGDVAYALEILKEAGLLDAAGTVKPQARTMAGTGAKIS